MGLHTLLVAAVVLVLSAVSRVGSIRSWTAALLGLAIAGATVIPVVTRYHTAAASQDMHLSTGEVVADSWDPARTFQATGGAVIHDLVATPPARPPTPRDPGNPGFLVLFLALLGLAARFELSVPRPLRLAPFGIAVAAGLFALGPVAHWNGQSLGVPTPTSLLDGFLGGATFRAPSRWLAVAFAAVAVVAAGGLQRLLLLAPGAARGVLGALAVVIALGETPGAVTGSATDIAVEPAARLLDAIDGEGALYENHGAACPHKARQTHYAALFHGRPLVGGIYARAFADIQDINRGAGSWPAPEAGTFLRAVGTRVTYEHPPLRPVAAGAASCQTFDNHRVCTLEPQALPAPAVVTESPTGPVRGLRWRTVPDIPTVVIQCGGHTVTTYPRVWALLTRLRGGTGVDVFLDAPCTSLPTASVGSPVPLYASESTPWLPAPPIRPRRMADATSVHNPD